MTSSAYRNRTSTIPVFRPDDGLPLIFSLFLYCILSESVSSYERFIIFMRSEVLSSLGNGAVRGTASVVQPTTTRNDFSDG